VQARPTLFGRYAVAEPPRFDLMHFHDGSELREVDHEPPVPCLDQEDLHAQGISVSELVPGAQDADALGSCTANATTVSLAERWKAASGTLPPGITGDAVNDEEWAIRFYHACTGQTGDPSQEWPPTDCGSTGLYCCQELIRQKLIGSYKTASTPQNLVSLLQAGTVIQGTPFFNSWMEPDASAFVDGDGSTEALQVAISSGVAGGHETCISAIEKLTLDGTGQVVPQETVLRVRNSWSSSWADNGSFRIHLSTLAMLGPNCDFKQFVAGASVVPAASPGLLGKLASFIRDVDAAGEKDIAGLLAFLASHGL
jgi:hypothetical protein